MTRHTKSKKTQYNNFELFRMRENLIPVEMLEVKDRVQAMAWEPEGDRFAVVHGDAGTPSVSLYTICSSPCPTDAPCGRTCGCSRAAPRARCG